MKRQWKGRYHQNMLLNDQQKMVIPAIVQPWESHRITLNVGLLHPQAGWHHFVECLKYPARSRKACLWSITRSRFLSKGTCSSYVEMEFFKSQSLLDRQKKHLASIEFGLQDRKTHWIWEWSICPRIAMLNSILLENIDNHEHQRILGVSPLFPDFHVVSSVPFCLAPCPSWRSRAGCHLEWRYHVGLFCSVVSWLCASYLV